MLLISLYLFLWPTDETGVVDEEVSRSPVSLLRRWPSRLLTDLLLSTPGLTNLEDDFLLDVDNSVSFL